LSHEPVLSGHDDFYNHGAGRSIFSKFQSWLNRDPGKAGRQSNQFIKIKPVLTDKVYGWVVKASGKLFFLINASEKVFETDK